MHVSALVTFTPIPSHSTTTAQEREDEREGRGRKSSTSGPYAMDPQLTHTLQAWIVGVVSCPITMHTVAAGQALGTSEPCPMAHSVLLQLKTAQGPNGKK
jgi:hypothetical protein